MLIESIGFFRIMCLERKACIALAVVVVVENMAVDYSNGTKIINNVVQHFVRLTFLIWVKKWNENAASSGIVSLKMKKATKVRFGFGLGIASWIGHIIFKYLSRFWNILVANKNPLACNVYFLIFLSFSFFWYFTYKVNWMSLLVFVEISRPNMTDWRHCVFIL